MLRSLLYVSTSTLSLPEDGWRVDEIVKVSRRFNPKVDITGALMFTEINFAQFLEGPGEDIYALLEKIRSDTRHTHIDVIMEKEAQQRIFPDWSMAYSGPHLFVADQFAAFTAPSGEIEKKQAAEHLIETMAALVRGSGTIYH